MRKKTVVSRFFFSSMEGQPDDEDVVGCCSATLLEGGSFTFIGGGVILEGRGRLDRQLEGGMGGK